MSLSSTLELYFANQERPGLYRTVFHARGNEKPVIGVRGTTIPTVGLPFIWGPACHALTLLFVSAVKAQLRSDPHALIQLEGPSSSPAGTLARLLKKRSMSWLHDLFASDASGRTLLHRMIRIGNPYSRQPGPITAALRTDYLPASNIKIFFDGENITHNAAEIARLYEALGASFIPRKDPIAHLRQFRRAGAAFASNYGYVLTADAA